MSDNIYNATDVPQSSSDEVPEKIHQEKGSKKRFNNHQTEDVVVGNNLHQPTSEYNSSRWQQQQHYEDKLLQQHDNFLAKYDINS